MEIYISKYKNLECIILENDYLKVGVLPKCGGNIYSIFDKKLKIELLWQNKKEYIIPIYGESFTRGNVSGIDEMFPSISECTYADEPWKGTKIPDHGEIWSLSFDYEISNDEVKLWTFGTKFPYKFCKIIKLLDNSINIWYEVNNFSQFDLSFIWALHPLFNGQDDIEVVLPTDVKKIINVNSDSKVLGGFGAKHRWPNIKDENNKILDLSKVPDKSSNRCEKFYIDGKINNGWCALYYQKERYAVEIKFPKEKVPYLGVWIDANGYRPKPQYNVALEPSTGQYDSLNMCQERNTCSCIKAKSNYNWWVKISTGIVKELDYENDLIVFE